MKEIERKVAIVTGGGSGIGRAIAVRFARAAGRVAVVDVAEPAAREVAREIEACGGACLPVPCDVSRQADVERAFQAIAQRLGPPDILVNSAGIAHVGTVEQTSEDDLDRLYAVNVKGVYNCMRAAGSRCWTWRSPRRGTWPARSRRAAARGLPSPAT